MKKETQKAFVLFYTILIVGAIMSSTSIMLSIYIKNLKLGGIARESVIAYSAAETGAECALYWYLNGAVFTPNSLVWALEDLGTTPPTYDDSTIRAECNGEQIDVNGSGMFTVYYDISSPSAKDSNPCAIVEVDAVSTPTHITSRGFNVCAASAIQVERGYEIRI